MILFLTAILIPLIAGIIGWFFFKSKVLWFELLLAPIPTLVLSLFFWSTSGYRIYDTERLSDVTATVKYFEAWDEYIHQTCTRTVSCGKDCTTTETYDCSYVDYHSEYWEAISSSGYTRNISKAEFDYAVKKFGNKKFVDMHRDYHYNDGDMYVSRWDKSQKSLIKFYVNHTYKNKALVNDGVFEFKEIPLKYKGKLFEWPQKAAAFNDPAVLGVHKDKPVVDEYIQRFNAINGPTKQVKIFILIFYDEDREIAFAQRDYWKGGNKNEFVVCLGLNSGGGTDWCESFFWSPDDWSGNYGAGISIRDYAVKQKEELDLVETSHFICQQVGDNWKRKSFEELDYLNIPIPTWMIITNFLLSIVVSGGVIFFIVVNDVHNDSHNNWFRHRR